MARRTRRNLSNPRIKRIVRHQIQASQNQLFVSANSSFNNFLRRFIFPLFVALVLFLGYSIASNPGLKFESFFGGFGSSQPQADLEEQGEDLSTKENMGGTETTPGQENKPVIKPVQHKLQVEVLNACGASGIASTVTKYLRERDIDVVNVGNHTRFDIQKTMLWERVKNTDSQRVAELLGVSNDNIESRTDTNLQLDITIILGADYSTLKPFKN